MATLQEYWEEIGIGGVLFIAALLFIVPEPITSFLGVVLVVIAAVVWLANWEG